MKVFKTCYCKLSLSYGILFKKLEKELRSHDIKWERFAQFCVAVELYISKDSHLLSEDSRNLLHELISVNGFKEVGPGDSDCGPILMGLSRHSETEWTSSFELLINHMLYCEMLLKKHCKKNPYLMERYNEHFRQTNALLRQLGVSRNIFRAELYYKIDALTANLLITASGDETGSEILVSKSIKVKMND